MLLITQNYIRLEPLKFLPPTIMDQMDQFEQRCYELFTEAIQKPNSEWPAFLTENCATVELHMKVQRLLNLHVRSSELLWQPVFDTYPDLARPFGGQIDEFKILHLIGHGGMGAVFLAEDTILKRQVAIKVVNHQGDKNEVFVEHFRREARAVARLSHPNIVNIYRIGEGPGFSFIAMDYIDGPTLRGQLDALSGQPERLTESSRLYVVTRLISQIADALDHAHRNSVIHRDVKPSNILINAEGIGFLSDFGIAKITTEPTLYRDGDVVGSLSYMSPEQARATSDDVDHRSDIFSLGVVLYEAISLRRPFHGATLSDLLKTLAQGRPLSLRKICRSVPVDLATICHKAIEFDRKQRYQTAAHFSADLRCFLDGQPILARPPSAFRRLRMWGRAHILMLLGIIISLLTTSLIALSMLYVTQRRAALGRLDISDVHRNAKVFVARQLDQHSFESPQELISAPVTVYLRPGLYRITIIDEVGLLQTSSLIEAGVIDTVEAKKPEPLQLSALVRIPSGIYKLGKATTTYPLARRRSVQLAAYLISPTEVSNREYREYIIATNRRPPNTWPNPYDDQLDPFPVTGISWDEANLYCRWRGMRLPTPDEWEAAALGPDEAAYPWGPIPHPDIRRHDSEELDQLAYRLFARPVVSDLELASPQRMLHMMSNVAEYTEGVAPDRNNGLVVKGRSWANSPYHKSADLFVLSGRTMSSFDRGFRVASSILNEVNDENGN